VDDPDNAEPADDTPEARFGAASEIQCLNQPRRLWVAMRFASMARLLGYARFHGRSAPELQLDALHEITRRRR
jgi:hypothetical protein